MSKKLRKMKKDIYIHSLIKKHAIDILDSEEFNKSAQFTQHGTMSVKRHCINVAKMSVIISHKLPIHVNERELIRGALLHDYFLYDWHNKQVTLKSIMKFYKMHGFTHPKTALNNATRDFQLTSREKDVIEKHMWPLTLKFPMCREAWIVTMADKYCSLLDTIHVHKGDLRG